MTVLVKINDSPVEFNFVVDTGGATFVDKGVADELGSKQLGPQARINTLHLPGFPIENVFFFTTLIFHTSRPWGLPFMGLSVPLCSRGSR